MFWTVAKSIVEGDFKLNIKTIREVNPATYDHLNAREPKYWCRVFYKGGMAYTLDYILDANILDARKKALLAMSWYVHPSGRNSYEVKNRLYSYGVHLEAPTVDDEGFPQIDVEIEVEDDGLDIDDMDQILHDLSYSRESKYNEKEIIFRLIITQTQFKEFVSLFQQSKQVPKPIPNRVNEAQEDNVDEHGVDETHEDNDKDGDDGINKTREEEDDEDGVDDKQVKVRTRKPSERITENMLKKIVVDKKGIGMALEKPLTLEYNC
ncbi:unnamed protein product [Lactuca saligna]|uniref:Uncharacterized protein n=1 Tax=Lactuca saligna TaxID=75948 RepID=A0AA36EL44_LACSI|nr:unnamed protein product [Lactuca saligna]